MKFILKTDDFRYNSITEKTIYFDYIEILRKFNIPASVGFIGEYFDKIPEKNRIYIRDLINKYIYPFNHSFSHLIDGKIREFSGTTFEYQRDSLYKTQDIIKKKFNYDTVTFGSVANSWDKNAIKNINFCSQIKYVYLYDRSSEFKKLKISLKKIIIPINGHGIIENKKWNKTVDYNNFLYDFFKLPQTELYVFQMHPESWKSADINEFIKIVAFLKTLGEFTVPELLK